MPNNPSLKKTNDDKNKNSKYKTRKFDKLYNIGLLVSFLVGSAMFTLVFLLEYYGVTYNPDHNIYMMLCDGFTIPGILLLFTYILVKMSKFGMFDAIVYATKLMIYTIFYKNIRETKLAKNYTEYRLQKNAKERVDVSFILIVAILFLVLAIIFLILFYTLKK